MKRLRMVCLVASLMVPAFPAMATIDAQILGEDPTLEQVKAELMRIGYENLMGLKGWGHYFTATAAYGGQRVLTMINTSTGEVKYWQLRKQPLPAF
jgi:hypothetical protein